MHRLVGANVKDRELVRDRRERLVRAALVVFLRKGYHDATVREIGREAGFTQGTIYNYVRSKSDILYLVCDEVVRAYQDAVAHAVEGIRDPGARLSRALRAVVESMYAHQDAILLLYHESHALDRKSLHAILAPVGQFVETFEGILTAAARARGLTLRHPRLLANIVTFLPTIVALRRWDLRGRVGKEELIRGVTEFMLRGLGAVVAAADGDGARRAERSAPRRVAASRR
ncbi:MAG: TetR/AcrR family transcriptional regulator [Candidatus Rokuibacteriota bacterium]